MIYKVCACVKRERERERERERDVNSHMQSAGVCVRALSTEHTLDEGSDERKRERDESIAIAKL